MISIMRGRTYAQIKRDLGHFKNDVISMKISPEAGDPCTPLRSEPPPPTISTKDLNPPIYPPKISVLPNEERKIKKNRFETS